MKISSKSKKLKTQRENRDKIPYFPNSRIRKICSGAFKKFSSCSWNNSTAFLKMEYYIAFFGKRVLYNPVPCGKEVYSCKTYTPSTGKLEFCLSQRGGFRSKSAAFGVGKFSN